MKSLFPFLLLLGLSTSLFTACNKNEGATDSDDQSSIDLSEFYAFYQQFHADSLFQMSRIIFPLEGLPREVDSLTAAKGEFRWQSEDWIMHKPFDFEMSEFKREITPYGPTMIQERIVHKTTGTGMIRRFSKLGGEWHLIYFSDMNMLARPGQG